MADDRGTVLAVDDDPVILTLLVELATSAGYEVLTAVDGQEAWEALETSYTEIDVILLDRMMPRMGGMELLSLVKRDPRMDQLPVIMQTSSGRLAAPMNSSVSVMRRWIRSRGMRWALSATRVAIRARPNISSRSLSTS